jgi:hypothetical protein
MAGIGRHGQRRRASAQASKVRKGHKIKKKLKTVLMAQQKTKKKLLFFKYRIYSVYTIFKFYLKKIIPKLIFNFLKLVFSKVVEVSDTNLRF